MVSSFVPLEGKPVTTVAGRVPQPQRRALRVTERVLALVLLIGLCSVWIRWWGWGQSVPGLFGIVMVVGVMPLLYRIGTARRRRLAALDPDTFWFGGARSWPKPGLTSFTKPTRLEYSRGRLTLDVQGISFEDASWRSWRIHWSEIVGLEVFEGDRSAEGMAVMATEGRGALVTFEADAHFVAVLRQLGADLGPVRTEVG